jgi:hypothetical protein
LFEEFGEFGNNFIEMGKTLKLREVMLRPAVKADGIGVAEENITRTTAKAQTWKKQL